MQMIDGKMVSPRRFVFAAALALVLCAVCVGGVSGVTVYDWNGLDSAISNTYYGGSVDIVIGDESYVGQTIEIVIDGDDYPQIDILGKSVTISNYQGVDVVFMKKYKGGGETFSIFNVGEYTDRRVTYAGSLTLTGISSGSITLDRTQTDIGWGRLVPYGSGVTVQDGGTFIMNGDVTIQNQRTRSSGVAAGVHVESGGAFSMNGGTITGNSASNVVSSVLGGTDPAGGVFIEGNADFEMSGDAEISGNYVTGLFGGSEESNFGGDGIAYYTIYYYKNDGATADPIYQLVGTSEEDPALDTNTYVRDGYTFTGWNTVADGSGTNAADGAKITDVFTPKAGGQYPLYAQWGIESYIFMFDTAGGTPESIDSITAEYGSSITVPEVTRKGYDFAGWVDRSENPFTAFDSIPDCGKSDDTILLTAQWTPNPTYTVTLPDILTIESVDDTPGKGEGTAEVYASNVALPEGYSIVLSVESENYASGSFYLRHTVSSDFTLPYTLSAGDTVLKNTDSFAEFTADGSVTLTAVVNSEPQLAGDYQDILTVTVAENIAETA